MRAKKMTHFRALAVTSAGIGAIIVLAGCSTATPAPTAVATSSASTATAAPTETAAPLALDAEGDAVANIDYFIASVESLLNGAPDATGREIIDHLAAAGFDKSQMEVTPDTTAVGLKADNIDFAIRINGDCLIGQSGIVGFHALAAPLLSTGTCLAGNTRAIDW
ncbi:MAG: hypothetical protein JWQ43_2858 [Glaciihabitans sp.]|nr:hypothetical protein [Glaciihabitans sp.]